MLNKKDFLKYASTLAFPIMLQNLIGTLVNIADTVMLGYVSQTAMSASSLANQYTFILFCYILWNGNRYFGFMCPILGKR